MAATSAPTGRFARRSSRGVLLGFSGWRCASLGAGAAGLLIGLLSGSLIVGVVLLAPFLAATFVRAGGLCVVEWTPVMGHWVVRKQTKQTQYRVRPEKPRPAGTLALPGDAAALRFYIEAEGGICVIHDPHRATLSAVLRVSHPAYALLSSDAQTQRVSMWGRAIASLGQSSACAGLQVMEATIPDSGKLAMSWAVAVDQADPAIAVLSRDALKRRQKTVRTQTTRKLEPDAVQPELETRRAGPTRAVAA